MGLVSKERAVWLAQRILPHEPALRAWLSRRAAGLEVDDIVQETYAILAGLGEVDHIRSPRNYMFEVAKSVVRQGLRRSPVVAFEALAEADGLQTPSIEPSPETVAADRQELGRVAALIAGLPPKCRQVFILRKVHGLSQKEIAGRLNLAESTVEKHVGKALAILTAKIGRGGTRRLESSTDREPTDTESIAPPSGERRRN
ncbi:RNA polymerase sigma factor [Phenylobacterium sp.]|uniref:RNA polymerase sigma factor n=1 Tax=Phenylobacterium sp. TaxID=1871053 RepID=UPI001990A24C|nr:RNA polymerase sigma factor [Phenylobacterium sp.]MBC7166371.1 RNA polymerase sigma factor [Phenylobacterium sp.]